MADPGKTQSAFSPNAMNQAMTFYPSGNQQSGAFEGQAPQTQLMDGGQQQPQQQQQQQQQQPAQNQTTADSLWVPQFNQSLPMWQVNQMLSTGHLPDEVYGALSQVLGSDPNAASNPWMHIYYQANMGKEKGE